MSHPDPPNNVQQLTLTERILIERLRRVQRLRDLEGPTIVIEQGCELVGRSLTSLLWPGWSDSATAQHERDLKAAAGECMVALPEPGSDLAKVVRANATLRREREDTGHRIDYLLTAPTEDDIPATEHDFPILFTVIDDPEFCERARLFLRGLPLPPEKNHD